VGCSCGDVDALAPGVLDNPVYASLTGPHRHFAQRLNGCVRYPTEVSAFAGFASPPTAGDWADLAELAGPATVLILTGVFDEPPSDWDLVERIPGVQLVDDGVAAAPDDEAIRLGPADVPDMLALVTETRPGPFFSRTVELGTYLGVRRGGRLVAMADERLHPPGLAEISAVCTAPEFRGQGLSTRLVHAVAHQIRARDETPFLHAAASNETAIRLYRSLSFRLARTPGFLAVRTPARPAD
jgi:ribosomal protein S18 acetylase RimI-like enzyme